MPWARRWRVDSIEKWQRILRALAAFRLDFARHPVELVVREEFEDKTPDQRKLFHAICSDLAPHLGLTPGQTKDLVKREFYGVEVITVSGRRYEFIKHSEESDRAEYSQLIDFVFQFGAEAGVHIPDRRAK